MIKKGMIVTGTIAVVLVVALLIACSAGLGGVATEKTGGISVQVEPVQGLKNIIPSVSMVCVSYDIEILDSLSQVVISENITGDKTYLGFMPGDYTISIVGKNDTGLAIGAGGAAATVLPGETATANVTITEYSASPGTLDILTDWTPYPGVVSDPVIESGLTYAGGVEVDRSADWVVGVDQASFFDDTLAVGFYQVRMSLFDDGASEPSAGFVDIARIAQGQVSAAVIDLHPNSLTGGLQVLIDHDFYEEMPMTSDVPEGDVTLYTADFPFTINVSADAGYTPGFAYYKQGQADTAGAQLVIQESDLVTGDFYRFDCIGWSASGESAGHLGWNIVKDDLLPEDQIASGDVNFSGWNGMDCRIEAVSTDGLTVLASDIIVAGSGTLPFEITGIPAGEFVVRMYFNSTTWNPPTSHGRYWSSGDSGTVNLSSADVLTVPPGASGLSFTEETP